MYIYENMSLTSS